MDQLFRFVFLLILSPAIVNCDDKQSIEYNSVDNQDPPDVQPRFFGFGGPSPVNPLADPVSFKEDFLHKKIRFLFSLIPKFPNSNPGLYPQPPPGVFIPPVQQPYPPPLPPGMPYPQPPFEYPGVIYGPPPPFYPGQVYPPHVRPPLFAVVAENSTLATPSTKKPPAAIVAAAVTSANQVATQAATSPATPEAAAEEAEQPEAAEDAPTTAAEEAEEEGKAKKKRGKLKLFHKF